MTYRMLYAALLLSAAACSSDARWNRFRETEPRLAEAREFASVECTGRDECTARWERTRQYVARYSATRIHRADAASIETGRPLEAGVVYLWATRAPAAGNAFDGDRARISLRGMCRGMYGMDGGPGWLYASCASQIRSIEMNFRKYVVEPDSSLPDDAA